MSNPFIELQKQFIELNNQFESKLKKVNIALVKDQQVNKFNEKKQNNEISALTKQVKSLTEQVEKLQAIVQQLVKAK